MILPGEHLYAVEHPGEPYRREPGWTIHTAVIQRMTPKYVFATRDGRSTQFRLSRDALEASGSARQNYGPLWHRAEADAVQVALSQSIGRTAMIRRDLASQEREMDSLAAWALDHGHPMRKVCWTCDGLGTVDPDPLMPAECETCDGWGSVPSG
jgi:hypothetical protein